jgi:hypothetical protein
MSVGAVVGLFACVVCTGAALAAVPDAWTQWTAVPQDTWIRSLDFTAATTLVAGGESDGVFQAGTPLGPWVQTNTGLDTVEAKEVNQVVASGGKLYAATDEGLFTAAQSPSPSWTQLGGGIGDNKLNMGGIESVIVQSPTSLVVAVSGAADPGVYTSADGGSTWTRASGMPIGENIYDLASGTGGAVIYAAGDGGVWVSVSGGTSWSLASDGINPAETAFRVAVASPTEIWAATTGSVYKSTNGGVTWNDVDGTTPTALPGGGVKKAFLLTPQFGAERSLVGTDDGVYASIDGGQTWGAMSPDAVGTPGGFLAKGIVWALGLGFTPPTLLAGTQGYGVWSLPMTPVAAPATLSVAPSTGLKVGSTLSAPTAWTGTLPFFFTYTWKKCTGASCTPSTTVGTGSTYTIPDADENSQSRYDVVICATNLVAPSQVCKTSTITTAPVAPLPTDAPVPLSGGTGSSLSPNPQQSLPWGTTYTINEGQWGTEGVQNVAISPDQFFYQWQRCDQSDVCTAIPGATGKTYTTTPADVGDDIVAYVRAVKSGVSSDLLEVAEVFTVIEKTPVNTAAPKIFGSAYVGQTLSSSAGAWAAHTPTYTRRWMECGADGLDCQPLNPDQTGATYTITQTDLGSRLELEVTATQADPSQNRVGVADSALTPVITLAPSGGGSGGGGGGAAPVVKVAKPKNVHVGSVLHGPATVSGYNHVAYQWLRNGKPITGATAASYKIHKADRGKKISLAVTLTSDTTGTRSTVKSNAISVPKAHKGHHRKHRHHGHHKHHHRHRHKRHRRH